MPSIRVTRPFTFSYPLGRGEKVAREKLFPIGDHEVDDEIAKHPWIARDFADGCIETPAQAQERAQAAAIVASKAQDDADYWKAHAEAAMRRAESLSLVQTHGDAAALERELNTPINQLGARQGAGISSSTPGSTPTAADEAAKAAADEAAKAAAEEAAKAAADAEAAKAAADNGKKKSK